MAHAGAGWFTRQVFTRTSLDRLPSHLSQHYGIEVSGVTELDVGVYRVARADGQTDFDIACDRQRAERFCEAAGRQGDGAICHILCCKRRRAHFRLHRP